MPWVADLPLIVVVARPSDEVFEAWRRTPALLVGGGATGVLCVGILWLTLLLGRELRRRHCAEQDLAELAATDSLTGLANRRQLTRRCAANGQGHNATNDRWQC